MNAAVLTIGTEIVEGNIQDTNARYISRRLQSAGLEITGFCSVRDREEEILKALDSLVQENRLLVITGGLGPTADDLTREVLARFSGRRLVFQDDLYRDISVKFSRYRLNMPPENQKQAYLPEEAVVIPNQMGTAPGFYLRAGECILAAFPGVPAEMYPMLESFLADWSVLYPQKQTLFTHWVRTLGLPESLLDEQLQPHCREAGITLGTMAHVGAVDLRFQAGYAIADQVHRILGLVPRVRDRVYSHSIDQSLPAVLIDQLRSRDLRLALAESCTGGMLAARFTEIPGASDIFLGGWVSYANSFKEKQLQVNAAQLEKQGAVSAGTARQMARGALRASGADIALSITGIAGPGGGTPEKPVGLVFIGLAAQDITRVYEFSLRGNRSHIREMTVMNAQILLWDYLQDIRLEPGEYFGMKKQYEGDKDE